MKARAGDDRELYLLCLGRVLAQLRGDRPQGAIARAAGMTQGTLSRFENGTVDPGLHRLHHLAGALRVAPDALVAIAEQCFTRAVDLRAKIVRDERCAGATPPPLGIAMMATAHVPAGGAGATAPADAADATPSGSRSAIPTPPVVAAGAAWHCDRRNCRAQAVAVLRCHRRGCHADFARCASHGGADGVRRAWRIHARLTAHEAQALVVK